MTNAGITVLKSGTDPITADIVFVHGLFGDAISTWTKEATCWPRDLLHQDLPNSRIMTWGYSAVIAKMLSSKDTSILSIFGHAENLLNDLAMHRRGEVTVSAFLGNFGTLANLCNRKSGPLYMLVMILVAW